MLISRNSSWKNCGELYLPQNNTPLIYSRTFPRTKKDEFYRTPTAFSRLNVTIRVVVLIGGKSSRSPADQSCKCSGGTHWHCSRNNAHHHLPQQQQQFQLAQPASQQQVQSYTLELRGTARCASSILRGFGREYLSALSTL